MPTEPYIRADRVIKMLNLLKRRICREFWGRDCTWFRSVLQQEVNKEIQRLKRDSAS